MMAAAVSPKLLVIADDLTGANDAGAQFAKFGIASVVLARPESKFLPSGFEVVVINTESRHIAATEAAARVRRAIEMATALGIRRIFKKTDSTLRGNLGAELQAVVEATGAAVLPFVPAFPQVGRTTVGGIHYLHGLPIAETEFARDPLNPVRQSEVTAVLRQQCTLPSISVPNPRGLPGQRGLCVIDCATADDLDRIVGELADMNGLAVLAGSAVLAEPLARVLPFDRHPPSSAGLASPVLIVNGSLNPKSLDQVCRAPCGEVVQVRLAPRILFPEPDMCAVERNFWPDPAIARGQHVLIHTIADRSEAAAFAEASSQAGHSGPDLHAQVAEALGRWTREALKTGVFGGLIVFGGDTLSGIAKACGWDHFVPSGEAGPGLTISEPLTGGPPILSKAGGFGDPDVIANLLTLVQRRP